MSNESERVESELSETVCGCNPACRPFVRLENGIILLDGFDFFQVVRDCSFGTWTSVSVYGKGIGRKQRIARFHRDSFIEEEAYRLAQNVLDDIQAAIEYWGR
jgi:hypothetical protein